MLVNQISQDTVKSNVVGQQSIEFDVEDIERVLVELRSSRYSHPVLTMIQEYLCNARDSHREAGCPDRPVQVTMPTMADAKISIKDFGVGLSPERVIKVFTKYGNSTKTQTNEQTGGFGIGAKSAWSYTDSFLVISNYEGMQRTYICHIGASRKGHMDLMTEVATEEQNGVEIQIALKSPNDIPEFVKGVYRATMFWTVRPILKGILASEIPAWYK